MMRRAMNDRDKALGVALSLHKALGGRGDTVGVVTGKGTKRRSIRVPDDEWVPFVEKAQREDTDASSKIRNFIRDDLEQES